MSTLSLAAPIGRLVAERPRRARVLDKYGIDYPCAGNQPLEEACVALALDPASVLTELAQLDAEPPDELEIDWSQASLKALISHLRDAHHAYMRRALPRLAEHVDDAFGAHAPDHPALLELRGVFHAFRIDVEIHMGKEEELFFPLVLRLDQYGDAEAAERLAMPMRVLERDHEREAAQLRQLTALGTALPDEEWARPLRDGLAEMGRDMREHMHKENNVLFVRALELASRLKLV